jgi:tetratricopeptide (TPR) repeat protein
MGSMHGRGSAVSIALLVGVGLCAALSGSRCAAQAAPADAAPVASTPVASTLGQDSAAVDTARRRVADGDLAGATTQLAAYVAAHPRTVEPARYLGDLYYRASNFNAAEATYLAILRYAPDDQVTHDRLGGIYAAEDRVDAAIAQFEASLPYASGYAHLVAVHRRRGDLDQFIREYRDAAEGDAFEPGPQYAIGAIYRAARRPSDAVEYLLRALAMEPGSCQTLSELGSAYIDLHENAMAIDVLKRCLAIQPGNRDALVNLSSAYIEDGRDTDALPIVQQANNERPDMPDALVNLGCIEDDGGRWQNALSDYLKAVTVDPLDRDAYVDLGYDYAGHGLYALAEAALLKGLSVSPGDGRIHYHLAVTYADQGKRGLARAEYERAAGSDEPEIARAASHDLAIF